MASGRSRWELDMLKLGELIFADCIELNFKMCGSKKHMLLMLDVMTSGL